MIIVVGLGCWSYFWTQARNELNAAIAKLDREDPGWRWDALQANRAAVADEENAAPRLEAVFNHLPGGWPHQPVAADDAPEEKSLVEQIQDQEPVNQLSDQLIRELRVELEKVKPAVEEARKLAGLPAGRFPAVPPEHALSGSSSPDYEQHPRRVANLLLADAALLAQDQQLDVALVSGRGILNAGRALGDDPLLVAHLVRIACRHLTVVTIERILAQGQPSESALRASQQLLEDEEQQPLLLYGLRGQRAWLHEQMGWMEAGDLKRLSGGAVASNPWWAPFLQMMPGAGWMKEAHARLLEVMTEAVEIAKLPLDEQADKLRDLDTKVKTTANPSQGPGQFFVAQPLTLVVKVADACVRSRAQLRCAIAALAAERYRLAHHQWPDSLERLVPEFLRQVPVDPYDRKPLRYQRLQDGVAIYSVGPDGKDDGGKLDRKNPVAPGTDMVFRLWNLDRRRQPPAPPEPPKPVPADAK
jgi:hypothetical protein